MTNGVGILTAGTPKTVNVRKLLLIILIFMPGTSTAFMSLMPIFGLILIIIIRGSTNRNLILLLTWLVVLSLAVIFLRGLVEISSINVRDLTEIMRLLALLSTVVLLMGNIEAHFGQRLLIAMLLTDLVLSLSQLQILPEAISGVVSGLYQSDFHVENAIGISSRALGLFSDPTTHGLAVGLTALFFLGDTMNGKSWIARLGLLISLFLVALAQSQTAFIATALGIFTFFGYALLIRPTLRGVIMFGMLFGGALTIILRFADQLSYLLLLFKVGLARNSFQRRIQKREDSIENMHDNPAGLILGWGKDYLGSTSTALDNEYLFVYLVYGLPGLLLFVILLSAALIYAIRSQAHVLLAATILGIIAAYPASFFTNLKTFTLYCLVITITINTNKMPSFLARLR